MKIKKVIHLVSFVALILLTAVLISACGTPKSNNSINTDTNIVDNPNAMENEQTTTISTSTEDNDLNQSPVSSTDSASSLSTSTAKIKTDINLDNELNDLDNTIKGADSKGFGDADLSVN
ncbi:MAG: hypothetical protein WC244_02105 [Patescibacteria group bacterium]|jgi:hypothetical protein